MSLKYSGKFANASLAIDRIRSHIVTCKYPHSARATSRLSFCWELYTF